MSTARHAVARRATRRITGRFTGRFTTRAAILAVVVGALLLAAVPVVGRYFSMRSQIGSTTRELSRLEDLNRRLEAKIERLHDSDYIERLARECLGMVWPGQVAFTVIPKHGTPKPAVC